MGNVTAQSTHAHTHIRTTIINIPARTPARAYLYMSVCVCVCINHAQEVFRSKCMQNTASGPAIEPLDVFAQLKTNHPPATTLLLHVFLLCFRFNCKQTNKRTLQRNRTKTKMPTHAQKLSARAHGATNGHISVVAACHTRRSVWCSTDWHRFMLCVKSVCKCASFRVGRRDTNKPAQFNGR